MVIPAMMGIETGDMTLAVTSWRRTFVGIWLSEK